MKKFFITSTGTGIGKTLVTTSLCYQLKNVKAIKPVISGWNIESNDTKEIIESLGLEYNDDNINLISPWRYSEPVSPDIAAEKEGINVPSAKIEEFCTSSINNCDYFFIEGAGGVMSPLTDGYTNLDLIKYLKVPVILVTGSYLGSISHTLTALEVLKEYTHAIIINESENSESYARESLEKFTKIPLYTIKRLPNTQEMWRITQDLTHII